VTPRFVSEDRAHGGHLIRRLADVIDLLLAVRLVDR